MVSPTYHIIAPVLRSGNTFELAERNSMPSDGAEELLKALHKWYIRRRVCQLQQCNGRLSSKEIEGVVSEIQACWEHITLHLLLALPNLRLKDWPLTISFKAQAESFQHRLSLFSTSWVFSAQAESFQHKLSLFAFVWFQGLRSTCMNFSCLFFCLFFGLVVEEQTQTNLATRSFSGRTCRKREQMVKPVSCMVDMLILSRQLFLHDLRNRQMVILGGSLPDRSNRSGLLALTDSEKKCSHTNTHTLGVNFILSRKAINFHLLFSVLVRRLRTINPRKK